jgi:Transmembrane secretion effector
MHLVGIAKTDIDQYFALRRMPTRKSCGTKFAEAGDRLSQRNRYFGNALGDQVLVGSDVIALGNAEGRKENHGQRTQAWFHGLIPLLSGRMRMSSVSRIARASWAAAEPASKRFVTLTIRMEPQPERVASSISLASYVTLLRGNRNFRRLWMAQIVSEIGDWFYTLSIYTLLLQLTGHASSVAMALVLQVLPQTFVGPAAGVVNDRIRRKHVMIAADLGRFVIVLAMLFVRSRSMVWLVYPLLLAETVMAAFFEPARNSVIPNVAPKQDILVANTLASATWSVNLLIGASVGGVVAAFFGRDAVFVLNAFSFLISAALIGGMHFIEPHAESAPPLRARDIVDFSPVVEGIRYIGSHRTILPTVFAKAGELMIGPSWVIFTVLGTREFAVHWRNVDPAGGAMLGMSIMLGGRGLGALCGPIISARWAGRSDRRLQLGIFFGYIVIAGGYGALGSSRTVWMAAACAMLAHGGGSIVWVFSTTLLQLHTDDRFRGRVFAADLGFAMLTIAAGAYICGRLLDAGIAARTVASYTGMAMLMPAVLWVLALRMRTAMPPAGQSSRP